MNWKWGEVDHRPTGALGKLGWARAKALTGKAVIVTTEKAFLLGTTPGPQPVPSQKVCQIQPWTLSAYGLYLNPFHLVTQLLGITVKLNSPLHHPHMQS